MSTIRAAQQKPHANLGQILRQARLTKAMRLKDVAELVGCSDSLLSKIENGKAAPSLLTLHRITEALGTSVAACFSDKDADPVTVYHVGERPEIQLGESSSGLDPSLERITPYTEGRALNAMVHIVPPGAGSEGALKHAGEEVGFVLEGIIELTVDGRVVLVREGSSFFFRSSLPHSYRNIGSETARIVWVNTPPF